MKVNPDIIFSIDNVPRCYWYVKDNQLYTLSFESDSSEMGYFKVFEASSFLKDYIKEDDIRFLSHKRVIVIGY